MKVFLICVRDEQFFNLLPEKLNKLMGDSPNVRVMGYPPLGIQTLAPILRQHGHRVRMFDTCHPEMKPLHILKAVEEQQPDVIAFSLLSSTTYPIIKSMTLQIKTAAPATPIILGGVFATMNAVEILKDCKSVDCVGVGEGETLLPDYLENTDDLFTVAGLVWRNGDEIIVNERRPMIEDLDRFPYPDRSSLPVDYIEALPLDVPAVFSLDKFCTIQTSRGCPFNCIYCVIPTYSNCRWRFRSAENVLGEMQELSDMGYRSVYFIDDHFLLKSDRIRDICNGIIDRGLEFHWGCEGRVDSKAIDKFALMSKANCKVLAFGIEAGTQKILDRLGKKQTLDQIKSAVDEAKKRGIERIHGFFIIGSPGETEEDIMQSFRFAARLKIDTFNFDRLCAHRGTPLWKEYVESGIIDDERDWYKYFKCSDIDASVLSGKELNRIRMKGCALLFFHRIFGRPIQSYKLIRSFSRNMEMSDIYRLLSSPFSKRRNFREPDLPEIMIGAGTKELITDQLASQ
ncbi:MAG: B12-binding domain-containing radical SAM protein [Nitrospinales bacterium]